jgi:uncharacterized Zn-binding protein involved in type VI secretion
MPKVALTTIDKAGGTILSGQNTVGGNNGVKYAVVGDPVQGHGDSPHNSPVMIQGSAILRINGIPVVLKGHLASCGHAATGSCIINVSR